MFVKSKLFLKINLLMLGITVAHIKAIPTKNIHIVAGV